MSFDLKSVLQDIDSGLPESEITSKHGISKTDLERVYAAKLKTENFVRKTMVEQTSKRPTLKRESALDPIFRAHNIGADERMRADRELGKLHEARKNGIISAEEFRIRLIALIRELLTKS